MKKIGKFILIVFGVIIAFGIIASMLGDDETSSSDKASTKSAATEEKVYQVGEKVEAGKLAYEVTNISVTNEIASDNEFVESAVTEGQFIIIDVTAYNNDSEARMVDSNMFKMKDDQGREFQPSSDSEVMMLVDGMMDFFLQDINPGLSKSGQLVFELPADATSYTLEVSSGFGWSGGEYEQIQLK
ncbi:DUF4352 domain-containing protein [Bacillus sp. AGMB 02131]|uniref:DUF4352 domain-containing protein n=1 Tax=Peribacillus faecalis TaxID=2772559 RepID=A0A927CZW7_9BACI|nr:DUF4352 domain-containing protein [Peribacillus faecalis]MBD3110149.1 DUF4352 domain-containing protein [Peribacillus faecalis]